MSYPLYPQIDPQEVQQAHQFNVTHQHPNNHTFNSSTIPSTYQTQNNFYPPQNYLPQHQFVTSGSYSPNQVPQSQPQYYYSPYTTTYPATTQNTQFSQLATPTTSQTNFPHLYQTQHTYPSQTNPVQTSVSLQSHLPVTQIPSIHSTTPIEHPQEASKPLHHPQQLSDEEKEDEEIETVSSIITTDRKLSRMLTRIERALQRLHISIMKRNRSGTSRSKEILETSIIELQSYHIVDAEERAAVNSLIQRMQLAIKHAEEELALMEQDRQRQLTQYRNAVMEIKKEAEQAQHLLESDLDQKTKEIIQQVQHQQY